MCHTLGQTTEYGGMPHSTMVYLTRVARKFPQVAASAALMVKSCGHPRMRGTLESPLALGTICARACGLSLSKSGLTGQNVHCATIVMKLW
jgi:hypothetical protein